MERSAFQKPTVIVPAGGSSRRFKEAGIELPKGLIRFRCTGDNTPYPRTMIEHVLDHEWLDGLKTIVATRAEEGEQFAASLPDAWTVCAIPETQGQADTVRRTIVAEQIQGPVLVVNSDNRIDYPLMALCQQGQNYAAATLVFTGSGDTAYSYVEEFPLFQAAHEKTPCSPWAIAGAFYFRDAQALKKAIESQRDASETHAGEYYLSGAMSHLTMGLDKLAVVMPRTMLRGWGTPEELARDPAVIIEDAAINKKLEAYR